MEDMIKKRTNETKQEISFETEKIINNYKDQERNLTEQISIFKRENEEIKNLYETSQEDLLKTKNLMEKTNSSLQTQIEMLKEELNKMESRMLLQSPSKQVQSLDTKDYQMEIAQLEAQMKQYMNVNQQLKSQIDNINDEQLKNEKEKIKYVEKIQSLEQTLKERPKIEDFNELKNRISILESLEFKNQEIEKKSIEQLLHEKNRNLEGEITQLKLQISNQLSELLQIKGNLVGYEDTIKNQKLLIEKLESDLGQQTEGNSQEKMLDIVSEQRNRFRKRVEELEEEVNNLQILVKKEKDEKERLKDDNIKMYEKVRYLQNYRNKEVVIEIEDDSKYKKLYDDSIKENLNPFNEFNKKEKDEKYKELSVAEKFMLQISKMMISNRYIRLFMFLYFAALHLMTLFSIYIYVH